ncbi:MAG: F0F1 ATP synthase subunit A [candidate division Zixibacteria bacterium]|nr:F0F1 ATP synthase subunit A [candidate division Zixibacteria bacterium]
MVACYLQTLCLGVVKWAPSLLAVATGEGENGGEHSGGHEGPPHLPNLIGLITGGHGWAAEWVNIIFAFSVSVFFIIVAGRVYANRKLIPGPFQNAIEMLVEGMYNFLRSVLGKDARKYTPFLGTLFFYILTMNFLGMIPFGHSPSTSINITASMAICVFIYAQYTGISRLGIVGYIDHLAGQPRNVISWCLVPLLFPMHIIGELAKPFSLALRLFGNITGEDVLIAAFVALGLSALGFIGSPIGLPFNIPFIFLGILLSTIQALVFTLLSTVYILMMLPNEDH